MYEIKFIAGNTYTAINKLAPHAALNGHKVKHYDNIIFIKTSADNLLVFSNGEGECMFDVDCTNRWERSGDNSYDVLPNNIALMSSIEDVNDMLVERGLIALTASEVRDWGIVGGESNAELQEWVNDYAGEHHTTLCENANAWRYEV